MVIGAILAVPIGVVGASVILLSLISLPPMLRAGYDKRLSIGTIASAGTLGILIPPSIMLVVMGEMLNTSVGALFAAATIPGFLLSGLYLLYIWGVAIARPDWAPKLPRESGPQTWGETWKVVLHGLLPMTVLMIVVLGSILAGFATATESAGVGSFGAILFDMKGTVPPECSMTDVYRGMYPFLILQVIGLFLCLFFPSLSLWLPKIAGMLD